MKVCGRMLVWLAAACMALASPTQAQPQDDAPVGTTFQRDISYGPLPAQKLDLYYRSGAKLPFIIFIHGGGWSSGDKSENLARGFVNRNFAVANINYRLVGEAPFPANIRDCQSAVRYLRLNGQQYGLDTTRIGVIGYSAGAQLAALLGTARDFRFDSEDDSTVSAGVQAVVDISGVSDFALFGSSKPGNGISRFFGATMAQVPDLVRLASPTTHVSKDSPPFLLIHGQKDKLVPLLHPFKFREVLKQAAVPVSVRTLEGEGHELSTGGWTKALQWAEDFFVEQLKP